MPLTPGTRLGPYEVVAPIGAGGMGQVYRATDVTLGRAVAIKVLPDALAADPDRMARFEREARTLASLNHPSIAAIYGFETYDGVRALIMEFVEGDDLSARIARHGRAAPAAAGSSESASRGPATRGGGAPRGLSLEDALPIARQIADALEAAHEIGVVHRDLKPANIRIRPDGTVKVLDFGLAKAIMEGTEGRGSHGTEISEAPTITSPAPFDWHSGRPEQSRGAMTQAGMILGTAAYMAPEQARGRVVDRRADIWAFGVVLFEMLTGRRVFPGDDVTDTIVSVVSKEPDWDALPPVPASLRRLLARCLKKDPRTRLRDIGEARVQIDELMSGSAESAAESSSPPEREARSTAWTWILAGATATLAATVMLIWAPWRPEPPSPIPEWGFGRRTFAEQAVFNARFMPDGQTIVFSSALSGNAPGLFEVRADSLVPRPFGPPRTHLLAVSSKGELAVLTNTVFLDHRLFSGTLARMPMDGAPRPLAEDVREVDWLPDGSDLVLVREITGGDQLEFPTGNVVHKVTGYLSDPRVSPDGSRVAFMEHPVKFDNRGFVKIIDRAGVVTTISGEFGEGQGIAWSADSKTVVYGTTGILSVPAAGGRPATRLTNSAGRLQLLDAAADGRMIVIRNDTKVGVIARGAGQNTERMLSTRDYEWGPSLSPDGRFAIFTQSGGGYSVLMRGTDGSPPIRLGQGNATAFSPAGQWVTANLIATGRCVAYPIEAGTTVEIAAGPMESCTSAHWSPDGRHVILRGKEPNGPVRAYVAEFPGGTPRVLLPEGLQLKGALSSGACLLAVDAAGAWQRFNIKGETSPVKGLLRNDDVFGCSSNGAIAFAGDNATIPAIVYRVNLGTGARQRVEEIAPADRAGLLDVNVTAYRENGQYAYEFVRGLSTLYVATPRK